MRVCAFFCMLIMFIHIYDYVIYHICKQIWNQAGPWSLPPFQKSTHQLPQESKSASPQSWPRVWPLWSFTPDPFWPSKSMRGRWRAMPPWSCRWCLGGFVSLLWWLVWTNSTESLNSSVSEMWMHNLNHCRTYDLRTKNRSIVQPKFPMEGYQCLMVFGSHL